MRFGTFTFLATGCAIALGVSPALSQEAEPPELEEEVSQTANSAVTQARIDIARLDGQVEGLTLQLETERALSAKVLATIQTVLTVYTAGAALVAFLLAFFGYSNLREHMERSVNRRVQATLAVAVDKRVDPALRRKELEWDKRFETLLQRVERLHLRSRGGGYND